MTKLTRIAAAMAALMAAPAFAATVVPVAAGTIYGGGATLPVGAYVGAKWLGFTTAKRLAITSTSAKVLDANPADPVSLFGQQTLLGAVGKQFKISYCATGSGTGRNVIRGTVDATGACGDYSGTPAGFSSATADADFAGTDAPFSASEYNSFASSTRVSSHIAPVQFPAIAGAIGIIYNNADLASVQLNLTESQLCQVFAGTITNWNQLNATLPSKAIKLVPRSDSSGTTFGFTNHLSATCSALATPVTGFVTQTTFTGTAATVAGLPAGAVPASGNGGVVTTVLATDGAIGYAEVADGKARAALAGGQSLKYATISILPDVAAFVELVDQNNADGSPKIKNGVRVQKVVKHKAIVYKKLDPIKDTPSSMAVTAISDKVLGANDANGRPTLVALTPASGATAGCVQVVDPSVYAKPALNTKTGNYVQYPIVAVSYLVGYNYGNAITGGTDKANALRNLFKAPYAIGSKVKTIGKKTGFAGLSLTLDTTAVATTGTGLVDRCVLN